MDTDTSKVKIVQIHSSEYIVLILMWQNEREKDLSFCFFIYSEKTYHICCIIRRYLIVSV